MNYSDIPIANIYYLLCYAWGHVHEADIIRRTDLSDIERVEDLLGTVLARGCFRLFRLGIDRGYKEVQEDLSGIRGKIAVGETVKRALRSRAQLACEFDELSSDVLHNQILCASLKRLSRLKSLHQEVRAKVHMAYSKFANVTDIRLSRRAFNQVQLDRNRLYYRFLLSVCELIYDHLVVDEAEGDARFIMFSEKLMWKVYEDFLIEFYRREQQGYQVNANGRAIHWVREGTSPEGLVKLPRMEADILLEGNRHRIIMDAKFYRQALSSGKLHSSHLYQLLAYLRNREAGAEAGTVHEGILLYPTVKDRVHIDVCLEGYSIRARSIDLAQDWQRIHNDLLAIVQ